MMGEMKRQAQSMLEDGDASAQPPPVRAKRHRTLRDADGLVWRIREISFVDTTPSLVFEAEGMFRRVRHYPGNWYELSDAQLYALSWRT